ncbi:hypothetical protein IV203_003113 [Nitzschia inconspicua]|uniref:Uncharacterized protein n=1 Tax=Nitzschia inconspicua TaxID=303405 RepID=A0A9K3PNE8_9STRA|nr:hypothetical protein IV203_003113 [Nitzschia inconspicua]
MATSFVFVLNENILETPCGKTSKPLNKQSLHLPSLDDDDDASSPDVATCIVDRHEIPKFKEDDEDDEGKENAKSLPCSRIVTPSLGSENDEEEDEDNPRSARINLASRFDAAMEDQN